MKNSNKILSVIKKTISSNIFITFALITAAAGSIVFAVIPPLVLENMVNMLVEKVPLTAYIIAVYFLVLVLSGLFEFFKEILITIFGQKITHQIRNEMCKKLSVLPASYFSANEPGVITSRFVGDVDTVEKLFASGIISMAVDVFKVISVLFIIFSKSLGLGLLMLAATPLLFAFTRIVQKSMLAAQIKNRIAIGHANNYVPETINNIRMIHSFKKEKYMEDKYNRSVQQSYEAMEKSNFYDAVYSPVILIVSAFIVSIMMILASTGSGLQQLFGMSVGTAVAIIAYVGKVFGPLESIGMEIQSIQSAVAGVKRINEFLNEPEKPLADKALDLSLVSCSDMSAVSVENLYFSYEKNIPVINDLSFEVPKGQRVTLTGRTGAGKSTIFKLLLGFYSAAQGKVSIFGTEAEKISEREKRRIFGYVEQSFKSVPGTVADQIKVFDKNISDDDMINAAVLADIHQTIMDLPEGYNTLYSDNIFSQGQKQLLSIARAVAANPLILLLDEITANLDSDTENKVLTALEKASDKRTVISISHRLYEKSGGRIINI